MATRAIDWEFALPLQSEEELRLFVEKAWGARIPDVQVCPDHSTPWRAFCGAYFAKSPVAVWCASRGFGGKSYLLALLALTEAVTLKCDVNVLGGSGEQSANVIRYIREFCEQILQPSRLLARFPERGDMSFLLGGVSRETRLAWGNIVKALMASQTSVRGPHIPRLRLDEADEMTLAIFDASLGQTMAKTAGGKVVVSAQTVVSSTHQYPDGTMTEVLRRAAENGWPVHYWCYKESMEPHGWLLASEVERKRLEVPATMFSVEYDLQEPSPQDRAIDPGKVDEMFDEEAGRYEGYNGEYIEVEPPAWYCAECDEWYSYEGEGTGIEVAALPGGRERLLCAECGAELVPADYSTGADWGHKRDWTVIVTFRTDVDPIRLVAFERCGREPWPVMVGKFNARAARYPGSATHDGTGLGDVVDGYVEVEATPYIMVGKKRDDLLWGYIGAIERGEILSPRIRFMYDEHRFTTRGDLSGGGHPPDSLVAGALAYWGRGGIFFG